MQTINQTDKLGTKNRIFGSFHYGKQRLSDAGHLVAEQSKSLAKSTNECIHHHAWKAISSMAVLGVVLGFMFRR